MNKVILMGRLTHEPELRQTASGTMAARFNLAVSRRFSKENKTDFIGCIAWDKTAEFLSRNFHKGNMIAIAGRIQTGSYQKDGQTIYTTDVMAEEIYFTGERLNIGNAPVQTTGNIADDFADIAADETDLPF